MTLAVACDRAPKRAVWVESAQHRHRHKGGAKRHLVRAGRDTRAGGGGTDRRRRCWRRGGWGRGGLARRQRESQVAERVVHQIVDEAHLHQLGVFIDAYITYVRIDGGLRTCEFECTAHAHESENGHGCAGVVGWARGQPGSSKRAGGLTFDVLH